MFELRNELFLWSNLILSFHFRVERRDLIGCDASHVTHSSQSDWFIWEKSCCSTLRRGRRQISALHRRGQAGGPPAQEADGVEQLVGVTDDIGLGVTAFASRLHH